MAPQYGNRDSKAHHYLLFGYRLVAHLSASRLGRILHQAARERRETIMGWGYCVKSLIYFVYPKHGLRMLARVKVEKSREFIAPGVFMVVYACLLAYSIYSK
jgi:hypothetical protein